MGGVFLTNEEKRPLPLPIKRCCTVSCGFLKTNVKGYNVVLNNDIRYPDNYINMCITDRKKFMRYIIKWQSKIKFAYSAQR